MTSFVKAAGVAGILVAIFATFAPDLRAAEQNGPVREGRAVVTELSADASAITYWVRAHDGWHVVTTVDTEFGRDGASERHAVVRFSAELLPGQSQLVSIPSAAGQQQVVLRIRRIGDQIEVVRIPGSA